MTKLDLAEWRGVLVVSGDGLVHEVYNGLFDRYEFVRFLDRPSINMMPVVYSGDTFVVC